MGDWSNCGDRDDAAPDAPVASDIVTTCDVAYWQSRFGYKDFEVIQAIEGHRAHGQHGTDADWELEQEQAETFGHNQETWEHVLLCGGCSSQQRLQKLPQGYHDRPVWPKCLVSLRGMLCDEDQVRKYIGMTRKLKCCDLWDEKRQTLNYVELYNFEYFILQERMPICFLRQLLFIRVDPPFAVKELSPHSIAPMLGYESTLPQYRFDSHDEIPRPAQDEYPVVYFLYGDLADRKRLMTMLDLGALPALEPAVVLGGKLMLWGRYKALVNGGEDDSVAGVMYTVQNSIQEHFMRGHETSKYEVVRCIMYSQVDDMVVQGLTFRFRDEERHLLREMMPSPMYSGL